MRNPPDGPFKGLGGRFQSDFVSFLGVFVTTPAAIQKHFTGSEFAVYVICLAVFCALVLVIVAIFGWMATKAEARWNQQISRRLTHLMTVFWIQLALLTAFTLVGVFLARDGHTDVAWGPISILVGLQVGFQAIFVAWTIRRDGPVVFLLGVLGVLLTLAIAICAVWAGLVSFQETWDPGSEILTLTGAFAWLLLEVTAMIQTALSSKDDRTHVSGQSIGPLSARLRAAFYVKSGVIVIAMALLVSYGLLAEDSAHRLPLYFASFTVGFVGTIIGMSAGAVNFYQKFVANLPARDGIEMAARGPAVANPGAPDGGADGNPDARGADRHRVRRERRRHHRRGLRAVEPSA
ncbi:MAG: hypothetical protein KF914_17415 [Rhizobiaceae bacterium]|nr:hypothetical protein [Rhizobiaceae bacterium]